VKNLPRAIWIGVLLVFLAIGACPGFTSALFLPPMACQQVVSGKTGTGADRFLMAQQDGVAKNPRSLTFAIRLRDNKDRFQQGEVIRVELSFSSALPKTYQLDGALYDRGGRLNIDSYQVDSPDGAVDPLKDREPGEMGGIRSIPVLDEKPYLIVRELNEYLRFDKPGKYRVYIVSKRVQREPTDNERAEKKRQGLVSVPATSNMIEFTIVPTDIEWARKQLQAAKTVLEARDRLDPVRGSEEIQTATRVIRFLGTEDAARYMVRHLDEALGDFGYGLMGSPFPAKVVKEMEDGLEAPDCSVSGWYLSVLLACSYDERYPHLAAPFPGTEDRTKLDLWQQENAKVQLARKGLREEYVKRLAAAVLKKEGRAQAVSLNTLLTEAGSRTNEWPPSLPAEFMEKLHSELTRMFFNLPARTQESLLRYQWARIKGPGMMPVLERYYENPSRDQDSSDPSAAGIALQRIYEMDPRRGRELILKEIAHPTGRVKIEVLSMLPDKTLPEMDETFASAMEKRRNSSYEQFSLQAQLRARYATPAILPRVKPALLEQDSVWSCELQGPIIAYYLRADPAFGAEKLEQALSPAVRPKHGCYSNVLGSVARFYACSELEGVAIRHLDDPEPAVVLNAVETLGKYGSAAGETPLWKRFEKWHDEWKEHAEEMQTRRIVFPPELEMPFRMENVFWIALASARAWLADAEKLKRIQALCLTEQVRQQVGYMISEAEAPKKQLSFMPGPGDSWMFQVAQYRDLSPLDAVKAKLGQYPKGTVFLWSPYNEGQAEDQKTALFAELKTFLAGIGMSLEKQQPPK
jgi:hypothetical protein